MRHLTFGISAILLLFVLSCQNSDEVEFNRYYSGGALIYQQQCQNCHGLKGEGLNSLIPPLNDEQYLKSNKTALACSIKYGLTGKITVAGKAFEGAMPANELSPVELAKVLTYINNSFGNKLGIIDLDQVTADLAGCK